MKYYFSSFYVVLILTLLVACNQDSTDVVFKSEEMKIEKLAAGVYRHISYLDTDSFGRVACNGMVVINSKEAVICDTPTNKKGAEELIKWIQNDENAIIRAVVVTHFHVDCLGSLGSFHDIGIPSYGSNLTIELASEKWDVDIQNGFDNELTLDVGDSKLISKFHGAGHTYDNVTSYYSKQKVLFGGCLIKSDGAGKGNLEDADVGNWSATVRNVKSSYPDVAIIIPGHGKSGDIGLLDYTIQKFE